MYVHTYIYITGIGFGTYQAVDFALVMDVLPSDKDKAKDLAVWHEVWCDVLYYSDISYQYQQQQQQQHNKNTTNIDTEIDR